MKSLINAVKRPEGCLSSSCYFQISYLIFLMIYMQLNTLPNAPGRAYWTPHPTHSSFPGALKMYQSGRPSAISPPALRPHSNVSPVSNRRIAEHFKRLRASEQLSSETCLNEYFSLEEFFEVMVC